MRAETEDASDLLDRCVGVGHHLVVRQPQDDIPRDGKLVVAVAVPAESGPCGMIPVPVHFHHCFPLRPNQVNKEPAAQPRCDEFVETEPVS